MNRILIVDDHSVVRAGITYLLSQEATPVEIDEAKDDNAALALLKVRSYSLVILDVNIPGTDTIALIGYMLTMYPDLSILIFTMNQEEWFGKRFLQMGVKGYLNKESTDDEIKKAIWMVLKGKRYISNNLAQLLSAEALDKKTENPFDSLSNREFEVVLQLIKGDSVSMIAETMNLHASTIGTHKAHVFQKLGVQNVIQLTDLAKLYGIDSTSGKFFR